MAKKFKYKLQSVLRYREIIEEERKRDFAQANRLVEEQKARAEALDAERYDLQDDLRTLTASGEVRFEQMINTIRYLASLDAGIVTARREEERLRREMEGRRQAFVAARRDKRVLEILKDKRYESYQKEEEHQRQQVLDELSLRALRRRVNEERNQQAARQRREASDTEKVDGTV